ncbi:MAG TPA: MFS transporter [Thermoanaerobaculaceae bacterium]|nr:MFS transporter [Thermoanaerobaculaceae bacterium]
MLKRIVGTYRAAFSGLPREVWIQGLATLVNRSGTMVLPFMSLYLTTKLGFSIIAAGQVLSLYGIGAIAGSWLGGTLSDRMGPVRVQVASLAATGAGFLVLSRLTGRLPVSLAVFGLAVVAECFRPALFTAIARSSQTAVRTRSLALVRLAVNLGMTVGPAAGGLLAVHHYGLLFVADAATCWAAALVLGFTAAGTGRVPQEPARAPGGALSPWRDGPYLAFLGIMVVLGTVFFQLSSTMPLYFRQHYHLAEDSIGLLLAINTVIIVAVEMVLLRALERRDHLLLAGLGCLLVCAGFGLLPLGSSRAFAALTVVVWTAGEMLSLPFTNSVAASRAPAAASGRYMGAYSLAFSVSFVLAPAVGTAVYQGFGPTALWVGVAATGAVLFAACALLARRFRAAPWAVADAAGGMQPGREE